MSTAPRLSRTIQSRKHVRPDASSLLFVAGVNELPYLWELQLLKVFDLPLLIYLQMRNYFNPSSLGSTIDPGGLNCIKSTTGSPKSMARA